VRDPVCCINKKREGCWLKEFTSLSSPRRLVVSKSSAGSTSVDVEPFVALEDDEEGGREIPETFDQDTDSRYRLAYRRNPKDEDIVYVHESDSEDDLVVWTSFEPKLPSPVEPAVDDRQARKNPTESEEEGPNKEERRERRERKRAFWAGKAKVGGGDDDR
jgi:hypothetical protein